ncbi:MAG TPA: hypothetical protein VGI40_21195 [Pirellulaceae bacterium]|jgi:hypothetical protein
MFRFTIRDLLWLIVVVAMGCGWWFDRREAKGVIKAQFESLKIYYDYVGAKSDDERREILKNAKKIHIPKNYLRWLPGDEQSSNR